MSSIYEEWMEAYRDLQRAKQNELMLRNAITTVQLEEVLEGSKTSRSGNLKIVATAKLNRSVDRAVLDTIWEDLTPEEQECVDFKPSLKLSNYKKIEATGGKLLEAVTVKPGQASLKITEEFDDEY